MRRRCSFQAARPRPSGRFPTAAPDLSTYAGRIAAAKRYLAAKDFAAADLLLQDVVRPRPRDLPALLLLASAQYGAKAPYAARRTLERAQRAHPKSYLPVYNLAHLLLRMPEESADDARDYYELGRELGGPADPKLEAAFRGR